MNKNKHNIFLLIIMIITCYLVISKDSVRLYIIDLINDKYNHNYKSFKDIILYNSLNKVVSLDNNTYEVIKVINEEQVVNDPIVYIYNTHETEKYSISNGNAHSITPTVKIASFILKDYLNDFGIESYVETKSTSDYVKKNNLSYSYTYEASRLYLKEALKENDYKILIDLHRDSTKRKYTLYEKDNKKYARIMFVLTTKHSNYKKNEKFANELNNKLNKNYKGLSRGILKRKDVIFNQDLSDNSILIELGGVDNTIDEINNSLYVLAKILSEYISEEKL